MAIILEGRKANNPLGEGLANLITSGTESYKNRADEMALQNAISSLGENASASDILNTILNTQTYSPQAKQQAFQNRLGVSQFEELQRQAREQEELRRQQHQFNTEIAQAKIAEKNQPSEISDRAKAAMSGLETLDEMETVGKKGNLGLLSPVTKYLSSDTAKDIGNYEQLGKSLIQLAAPMKITNRQEFEEYATKISDPSLRDAEREGIIQALRLTIMKSLENENDPRIKEFLNQKQSPQTQTTQQPFYPGISLPSQAMGAGAQNQGNRPPLSLFNR